jgi:hypothetical protein
VDRVTGAGTTGLGVSPHEKSRTRDRLWDAGLSDTALSDTALSDTALLDTALSDAGL